MSQEPTPASVSPTPPRRSPLPAGAALIVLLVLLVAFGAVVLNRPPAPDTLPTVPPTVPFSPTAAQAALTTAPTGLVGVAATASPSALVLVSSTVTLPAGGTASPSAVAGISGTATLSATGTLAAVGTGTPPVAITGTVGLGTGTPMAALTSTVGVGTGTPLAAMTGTVGTGTPMTALTGTVGLGTGTPMAAMTGTVGTGTPAALLTGTVGVSKGTPMVAMSGTVGLGTGTPVAAITGTGGVGTGTPVAALPAPPLVLDSTRTAYLCPQGPGCNTPAVPNAPLPVGGEARTTLSSTLRLQTAAGLLTLAGDSAVRLVRLDAGGTGLTLTRGRVLARAAAGRTGALAVTAGGVTVTGTGTTFSVVALSDGGVRVSVPAAAPRPVAVQTGPAGSPAADLGPGKSLTLAADGTVTLGPLDPTEIAALVALGGGPPATPAAVAAITVLPVPTLAPYAPGVVTATIVLTPPAEQTLPPVTLVAGATAVPAVPPGTTTAPPTELLGLAVTAMGGAGSYTFGATLGADPAGAEFTAGTWTGDTACWISTGPAGRSDYQWRGGTLFRRNGTAAWQQQADGSLPPWITIWRVLGQTDPATVSELPSQQLDAVTVRHLRARLLPVAGYPAGTWADVTIGAADSLVRSLILYDAEPGSGHAILKIGFSSLGTAAPCPPLSAP